MSAALRSGSVPRCCTAAELAHETGLSLRTVRRHLAAGTVRGVKIGRRVLIPVAEVNRLILHRPDDDPPPPEATTMAIAPSPYPPTIDPATGRARPLSAEERKARSAALARALEEIAGISDETDTEETFREIERGLDAARTHRLPSEGQS